MKKQEMLKAIAEKTETTQKTVDAVLNAFGDLVVEEVKKGERIQIPGFGTFSEKKSAARDYKSPITKEVVHKEASVSIKFKVAEKVKEYLNAK